MRPRRFRPGAPDAGVTLVETTVAMLISSVFLVLFSSSILALVRTIHHQNGTIDAQQTTRTVFLTLDRQIRYADAFTTPATIGSDQYVEWRVPDASISTADSAGQTRCYQWKASSSAKTLQYRSWVVPTSGTVAVPDWTTAARGVVIGSVPVFTTSTSGLSATPFSLPAGRSGYSLSAARIGVVLSISLDNPPGRSAQTYVFTALNSGSTPSSVCGQVARS